MLYQFDEKKLLILSKITDRFRQS